MITLRRGDLCTAESEAIVREAVGDGTSRTAVGRRIEMRVGDQVRSRIEQMGDVPVGTALLTPGGELPASFVLHVVVASFEEPITLGSVEKGLRNGLRRCTDFGIRSLALPPVGFGVGNLDAEGTAEMLVAVLHAHLDGGEAPHAIEIVVESEFEEEILRRAIDRAPERL